MDDKLRYVHTTKYSLAMKSNDVLTDTTTWTNLKIIVQSEINKTQKVTHCVNCVNLPEISRTDKLIQTESRLLVIRGLEKGGIRSNRIHDFLFI